MTKLVVDELKTTLSQTMTVDHEKRILIAGIRPYIYMHNSPAGTFTLSIKDGGVTVASKDFTSTEIKSDLSTSDNYAHLFKRLVFDNPAQLTSKEYELELSASGYSFSESGYLGWVREHENQFNRTGGTPFSDIENPRSFQLFEYQEPK